MKKLSLAILVAFLTQVAFAENLMGGGKVKIVSQQNSC